MTILCKKNDSREIQEGDQFSSMPREVVVSLDDFNRRNHRAVSVARRQHRIGDALTIDTEVYYELAR